MISNFGLSGPSLSEPYRFCEAFLIDLALRTLLVRDKRHHFATAAWYILRYCGVRGTCFSVATVLFLFFSLPLLSGVLFLLAFFVGVNTFQRSGMLMVCGNIIIVFVLRDYHV